MTYGIRQCWVSHFWHWSPQERFCFVQPGPVS